MFMLLTYDVDFSDSGRKRLTKVAKICEGYGVRVQKSVFEMDLNLAQFVKLKGELMQIIDIEKDSVRIYKLGKNYRSSIEVLGKEGKIELSSDNALML